MDKINNFLLHVGFYGPILLIILLIYNFYNKNINKRTIIIIIIFSFINITINLLLKNSLKQSRPPKSVSINKYDIQKYHSKYGMPSGHAQNVSFYLLIILVIIKNRLILLISTLISFLTLFQRVYHKKHFIDQVIVGFIIGIIIGRFCLLMI
jgi:membrane-associated phospholipid phosphatase